MQTTWKDRAAMLAIVIVIVAAFAGAMRVAGAIGGPHGQPCTSQDVTSDRCSPQHPEELPSGTD